jgi:hypothetical protein
MFYKIVFDDGSWVEGRRRNFWEMVRSGEMPELPFISPRFRHYVITKESGKYNELISKRVDIPICKIKFHIFLKK